MTRCLLIAVALLLSAPVSTAHARGFWRALGHAAMLAGKDGAEGSAKDDHSAGIIPETAEKFGEGVTEELLKHESGEEDREDPPGASEWLERLYQLDLTVGNGM
jgi:hypothetical protein